MGRLTFETPAPFMETRELMQRTGGPVKPHLARMFTVQAAECASWGVRLDGRLMAVLFFLELAEREPGGRGLVEVALAADPAGGPHVRECLAFTRLILATLMQDDRVAILARVRPDNSYGHRLAGILGFKPAGLELGLQLYRKELSHEPLGREQEGPAAGRGGCGGGPGAERPFVCAGAAADPAEGAGDRDDTGVPAQGAARPAPADG